MRVEGVTGLNATSSRLVRSARDQNGSRQFEGRWPRTARHLLESDGENLKPAQDVPLESPELSIENSVSPGVRAALDQLHPAQHLILDYGDEFALGDEANAVKSEAGT